MCLNSLHVHLWMTVHFSTPKPQLNLSTQNTQKVLLGGKHLLQCTVPIKIPDYHPPFMGWDVYGPTMDTLTQAHPKNSTQLRFHQTYLHMTMKQTNLRWNIKSILTFLVWCSCLVSGGKSVKWIPVCILISTVYYFFPSAASADSLPCAPEPRKLTPGRIDPG